MKQTRFHKNINGKVYIEVYSTERKLIKEVETGKTDNRFIVRGRNIKGVFHPLENTYIEVERERPQRKEKVINE